MAQRENRKYSDEEKAEALAVLVANGGNLNGTAKQLGINRHTLTYWAQGNVHPAVVEISAIKKDDLRDMWLKVFERCNKALTDEKLEDAPAHVLLIGMGTATDKVRALCEDEQNAKDAEGGSGRTVIILPSNGREVGDSGQ